MFIPTKPNNSHKFVRSRRRGHPKAFRYIRSIKFSSLNLLDSKSHVARSVRSPIRNVTEASDQYGYVLPVLKTHDTM